MLDRGTQWMVLNATIQHSTIGKHRGGTQRRSSHAPRAVGGTPTAPDRSTGGTMKIGATAGNGEALP